MKNKVLYLYENEMPTTEIFRGILEQHDDKAHYDIVSVKTVSAGQFNSADVIIFIRPCDIMSSRLLKKAKNLGKFVIVFCDDDLYEISATTILDKKRKAYFRKNIALADLFYTSSPRLAERYKAYYKSGRTALTDTTVDSEDIIPHRNHSGKVRIVYAAGGCHKAYFEKLISPILDELFSCLCEAFSLTFIGVHPDVPNPEGTRDIKYLPMMPLTEYRHHMAEAQYDIGIAPISDDEFSKCKYFNKYLEYSMMGVCGIYSDSEPYTYAVKNGVNGLLAGFNPEDWLEALKKAITDEKLRTSCVKNAQQMIEKTFTYEAIEQRLNEQMPELKNYYLADKTKISQLYVSHLRLCYKLNRIWLFSLSSFQIMKNSGFKAMIQKIKNHI